MKILHVEDNESLAESYKRRVQEAYPEIEILQAASYDEAAELLRKNEFDLIVSDFSFPGKGFLRYSGGMELFRLVIEEYPKTPVHFLSNMASSIKNYLDKCRLSLRTEDKIFCKGSQRALFEAFGQKVP
ncbi:MAG: response regulator [Bdellovibrionales bacterium]